MKLPDVELLLRSTPGVQDVHDLHVWAITSGKPSLSAHLVLNAGVDTEMLRIAVSARLREQFGIRHSTLQCEFTPCDSDDACALAGELRGEDDHAGHAHVDGQHDH